MTRPSRRFRRTLASLALTPFVLAACGGGESATDAATRPEGGAASLACANLPSADPNASLPADFPTLSGQVLYMPSSQGQTTVVFGRVEESSFVGVRDELVDKLKAMGYEIEGTDQEAVEAEAEFKGPHEGTIKVEPLCMGAVSIRYKLNN